MNEHREPPIPKTPVRRRAFLGAMAAGLAAASVGALSRHRAAGAAAANVSDKRKARYRADSAEVQSFYRVNRYPGQ
jgi:hypothetical protein